jgi:hypothetical protein
MDRMDGVDRASFGAVVAAGRARHPGRGAARPVSGPGDGGNPESM